MMNWPTIRDAMIVVGALGFGAYDLVVTPPLDATTATLVVGLLVSPAFLRRDAKMNGET